MPSDVRNYVEGRIRAELKDKKLWVCVDKITDQQKNSVVNVEQWKNLNCHPPSYLLLRVAKCTSDEIFEGGIERIEQI